MQISRLFAVLLVSFLFSASADSLEAQTITHVPMYTFYSDSPSDSFGASVSSAGDVNGDGFADVIVGAPWDDNNGNSSGSARVLSGIDGSVIYNFDGDSASDSFGWSVSGAGDVNGDGTPDLIVGATGDDNNGTKSGSARVLSGIDGSILYNFDGDSGRDIFGYSVSGAGDVNGDGFADLIVGAINDDNNGNRSGSARVLSGIDGSVIYNFDGDSASDSFGWSVSSAGDVNGDGFADTIVGARWEGNSSARVLSGIDGSVLHHFGGDSAVNYAGYLVSSAGDVNGDGIPDLIVGAPTDDYLTGSVRVLSGSNGNVLHAFVGNREDDRFGSSVSGAGDVNGDGFADLIVGASGDDNNGYESGSARVLSGIDGSVLYNFDGDGVRDSFGVSVSGAGDINGDGIDDFIVGAFNGGANFGGYARVFVSQISEPLLLGDVNQDGVVNFRDILPFVLNLFFGDYLSEADTNEDGVVDFSDIPPFIEILTAS